MTIKGFVNLGDSTITNDVRENIISYLDYNLLLKGNFITVEVSPLANVDDPRYGSGEVWATYRKNLVWESGGVSGVSVDSVFVPTSGGDVYVDYANGRFVFASGRPITSSIEADFLYKYVNVVKCDGVSWFTQIQGGPFLLPENSTQLPIMGVEIANGTKLSPYQLGGGQYIRPNIFVHCVAEDSYTRDSMVDIVLYQNDATFRMYDLNAISDADAFPLDYRGVPASGALTYPDLVSQYGGRNLSIIDSKLDSVYELGSLFVGTVKLTTEVVHFGV